MYSPLLTYVFLHETVEHKNEESWNKSQHRILIDWLVKLNLTSFYVLFFTLKAVKYGEQVEEEHFDRTPSEKSHRPGETQ